jgi:hypothetical protein
VEPSVIAPFSTDVDIYGKVSSPFHCQNEPFLDHKGKYEDDYTLFSTSISLWGFYQAFRTCWWIGTFSKKGFEVLASA